MLNDFWDTAPAGYKYTVFGGMGLTALGIIIIIIGAASGNGSLTFVGLPMIGAGLIAHMTSMVLRGRSVRKSLKEAEKRSADQK